MATSQDVKLIEIIVEALINHSWADPLVDRVRCAPGVITEKHWCPTFYLTLVLFAHFLSPLGETSGWWGDPGFGHAVRVESKLQRQPKRWALEAEKAQFSVKSLQYFNYLLSELWKKNITIFVLFEKQVSNVAYLIFRLFFLVFNCLIKINAVILNVYISFLWLVILFYFFTMIEFFRNTLNTKLNFFFGGQKT